MAAKWEQLWVVYLAASREKRKVAVRVVCSVATRACEKAVQRAEQ